jgi:hypothetical protein
MHIVSEAFDFVSGIVSVHEISRYVSCFNILPLLSPITKISTPSIHLTPFWGASFTNTCTPQAIMPTQPFIYIPKGHSALLRKQYRRLANNGKYKCLFKAYIKAIGPWLSFTGINMHQWTCNKMWQLLILAHVLSGERHNAEVGALGGQ